VAQLSRQNSQAAHKGAADPENMNVHCGIGLLP
jgi:hypothetical protein